MYAGPTKAITGPRYSRFRLGNEEFSNLDAFRYLEHIITADSEDDRDNEKQFRS